jgi:hypothetical protein
LRPGIANVAHEVAIGVLRDHAAEPRRDPPEGERGVALAVALDREAADQMEAAAPVDLVGDALERLVERSEREVATLDLRNGLAGPTDSAQVPASISPRSEGVSW